MLNSTQQGRESGVGGGDVRCVVLGEEAFLVVVAGEQEEHQGRAQQDGGDASHMAQSAPSTNDVLAAAVICDAYCGCCSATASALENERSSCVWTLSVIFAWSAAGAPAMALATAVASPAVSSAPVIDCMMAPPRSTA